MKVQWTLYNIALPTSVMVTLAYWMLLYKPGESVLSFGNISTHAANVVLMLIEEYCSRMPTRILHLYQPITYCVIYGIFNISVWGVSQLVIYSIFDWTSSPGFAAGLLIAMLVGYGIVQFFLFVIYFLLHKYFESVTPVLNRDIPLQ
ncbi:hypothetical protein EB796_006765 [Bugula neritina]|uniref:Uncharacterized protein n=1 Tax=Bugula neritina TaxID=10212 RepID=A0A7J7K9Q8_BUGNE|nr:hypothetical protein EB796_006765 [Bugula neritina]